MSLCSRCRPFCTSVRRSIHSRLWAVAVVLEACLEWGSGQGESGAKGTEGPEGEQLGGSARFWSCKGIEPLDTCGVPGAGNPSGCPIPDPTQLSPCRSPAAWPLVTLVSKDWARQDKALNMFTPLSNVRVPPRPLPPPCGSLKAGNGCMGNVPRRDPVRAHSRSNH